VLLARGAHHAACRRGTAAARRAAREARFAATSLLRMTRSLHAAPPLLRRTRGGGGALRLALLLACIACAAAPRRVSATHWSCHASWFEHISDAHNTRRSPLLVRRAAPAPRARHHRALLGASACAAGYAPSNASNAASACAACPVGMFAPGTAAVCALPGENPLCWGGWPDDTFLAAYNSSSVAMLCRFAADAPSLAASASASCSFADTLFANCTLRTHYGAARTATVADCAFDAAGQAALSDSSCTVLGAGGAALVPCVITSTSVHMFAPRVLTLRLLGSARAQRRMR
jgi:hypothetical protein